LSCLRHSAWLLLLFAQFAFALPPAPPTVKQLFEEGRFEDALNVNEQGADADFYRGLALAKLGRSNESRNLFLGATQQYPADKRFPIELAGLAFQRKDSGDAVRNLRRALRIDPADAYANNLLASIYLLESNLEAALKYWNRIGKPQLNRIVIEPELRTDPVLLNRAFVATPASTLLLKDFETTEARLSGLQVFAASRFTLRPTTDGEFDLVFRGVEKLGFGDSKPQAAIRLLRGLPYQTVYPEYFNIRGSAANITSMIRWDPDKRRAALRFSAPLPSRPAFRLSLSGDVRDENWELLPGTASPVDFNSRPFSIATQLDHIVSGRWNWGMGTALLHENVSEFLGEKVFGKGYSLQYFARVEIRLLNLPERRLNITSHVVQSLGRNFATPGSSFARTQASTELKWLPGNKAGNYEFTTRFSGGYSRGTLPFSDLFMLGLERDNNLLLRGHVGTRDGRKGSAPMAQAFLLSNVEFTRRIFSNGLIDIKLGPFLDIAKPYRTLQPGASSTWLYDPGVALKIRVLGATTVTFTYGRNTNENRNAFYVSALQ
jgi:tetratricopeptide (TPR) repeat protein